MWCGNGIRLKMADASMEGIDLYADVDDFGRVSA